jgi:hypothetical protein
MTEAELLGAMTQETQLAYTTGQWWITMTTAFVVGVFFARRVIPLWLFVLILALYVLTVFSVMVESVAYNQLATEYGNALEAIRVARHAPPLIYSTLDPVTAFLNLIAIYAVYVGGGLGAIAYCVAIWRKAHHVAQTVPTPAH